VKLLRTALYVQAAVWTVCGLGLAIAPHFLIHEVFQNPFIRDWALIRTLGVVSIGMAMLMVLVAQRLEDVWWWAWAFILTTAGVATVCGVHAAFGDRSGRAELMYWIVAAVNAALAAALLLGMGRAAQEKPFA
jgi:hypothetical protein